MTTKELMSRCQSYYGLQYSHGLGDVVVQYLDTVRDDFKAHLFAETVKTHSVSFKSLPDVSIFESVYDKARVDYYAEHSDDRQIALPEPSERASDREIDEFEKWFHSQVWKKGEFTKFKDWKENEKKEIEQKRASAVAARNQ